MESMAFHDRGLFFSPPENGKDLLFTFINSHTFLTL